ncbi:MAG TPA: trypsin-like peptidase domain-containing protein [Kofleriaceae bacterium]|nr:trypsin-like peptidase domain-containing protein [Kofleriaceae bacterium]
MAQRAIDWSEQLAVAVERAGAGVLHLARRRHGASATVWDAAAGLVVTAHHALGGDERAQLTDAGGAEREAEVVGRDPGTDLALLRVADPAGLVAPELREVDGLKVGHATLALGRPGRSVRASLRIVGVLGTEVRTPWGGRLERYVETDRGFPRGFSGGPLVDLEGRALGVNTSGLLRGADVTVPTVTVRRVVGELLAHGSVRRGYLGVAVQRARLAGAASAALGGQTGGALVVRVDDDSPAARAGLVMGDVLVALDGEAVEGPDDVRQVLLDRRGKEIEARIVRVGAVEALRVTVGEQ